MDNVDIVVFLTENKILDIDRARKLLDVCEKTESRVLLLDYVNSYGSRDPNVYKL